MRIAFINVTYAQGSTGALVQDLAEHFRKNGHQVLCLCGRGEHKDAVCVQSKIGMYIDGFKTRIFDNQGFNSKTATKRAIVLLKEFKPDIINVHNIHGYFFNLPSFFKYLADDFSGHIFWTLHDSWAYTGHCSHYLGTACGKWKTHCEKCPLKSLYPKSYIDRSKTTFDKKQKCYDLIDPARMHLVTPSDWLKNDVKKSALFGRFNCQTIHNGIHLELCNQARAVRRELLSQEKEKIILGVANNWNSSKGLDDFIELSKQLPPGFKIRLIGSIKDKKIKIPSNIDLLGNISDKRKLYEEFAKATVFFNPTKRDNYPTVDLEAQACGTPVVAYDVGGVKETVKYGAITRPKDFVRIFEVAAAFDCTTVGETAEFSVDRFVKDYESLFVRALS